MNKRYPLWMILSLFLPILLMAIISTIFWLQLDTREIEFFYHLFEKYIILALVGILLVIGVLGFLLNWLITNLIVPLNRLAEETILMTTVNPSHRIKERGSKEIKSLANVMNDVAKRVYDINMGIDERVNKAGIRLENEKNTLAALISGLADGIMVCNIEGQIILYNHSVKKMFFAEGTDCGSIIGLGRSLFGVMNKDLVVHSLEDIKHSLDSTGSAITAQIVVKAKTNKLLRTQIVPILNHSKEMIGFIVIANDVTEQVEGDVIRDSLFQSLVEQTRSSIAVIRTAVEVIIRFPDMGIDQRDKFREVILNETVNVTDRFDKEIRGSHRHFKIHCLFDDMSGQDFLSALKRRALDKLSLDISTEINNNGQWMKLDSHSFIQSILFLLNRLKSGFAEGDIKCRLDSKNHFINVDLIWDGKAIDVDTLNSWADEKVFTNKDVSITFREAMKRHDAEIWSGLLKDEDKFYIRLLLKSYAPPVQVDLVIPTISSRPEFYDFDMFHQAGQTDELDNRLLTDLSYTIFDTETTGLHPSEGDEIISIGAIRAINGRLLRDEVYEQLVNPKRSLSPETVEITGIRYSMLNGQPIIDDVLPIFHNFVDDSILVAHNAAFDMRFLQLKEKRTGIKFINPVLDTLLLSAVIHPNHESHSLEDIAKRLGINIMGRHTALGDAIATGEVFLKLLSLLKERGITTLKEARLASEKTYYARIKF